MTKNCSDIFVFVEEWERRRKVEPLEFGDVKNITFGMIFSCPKMVESLQKWSDEHPIQTRKEKFIQMCRENGFECPQNDYCCYHYPYCVEIKKGEDNSCEMCEAYWNSPAE